jgi:hypothetical protein
VTSAVRIVTFGWVVGECRSQALLKRWLREPLLRVLPEEHGIRM